MAARKPRSTGQKKTGYVVTGSFGFGPFATREKAEQTKRKLRAKSKKIQLGAITGKRGMYRFRAKLEFLVGNAQARDKVKSQIKKASPRATVTARKVNI